MPDAQRRDLRADYARRPQAQGVLHRKENRNGSCACLNRSQTRRQPVKISIPDDTEYNFFNGFERYKFTALDTVDTCILNIAVYRKLNPNRSVSKDIFAVKPYINILGFSADEDYLRSMR